MSRTLISCSTFDRIPALSNMNRILSLRLEGRVAILEEKIVTEGLTIFLWSQR
jgi:hypothetical protein